MDLENSAILSFVKNGWANVRRWDKVCIDISMGKKIIDEKTNEIPAAQEILRLMYLRNTIVTAAA